MRITRERDKKKDLPSIKEILTMNDNRSLQKFNTMSFEQQLDIVMNASGQERIELMQQSDQFVKLVRSLPAPEVLFTYEQVGVETAMPMIAATTYEQFTFLTDLFCWDKESIDPKAIVEWLQILSDCGQLKIRDWLTNVDPEWFMLIVKSLVNIYKSDEEGNVPDFTNDENIFTIDGIYYFECIFPSLTNSLQIILDTLRNEEPEIFRSMMEMVIWSDMTEVENNASHFRQSRLAEWGFPDLDEALEVYQYFTPQERMKIVHQLEQGLKEWSEISNATRYPIKFQDRNGFLTMCLHHVHDETRLARFSHELMLLANKVQVADGMEHLGVLENLIVSSKKVTGYVTIGLAELSNSNSRKAAELIGRVHTERLFQAGFSQVQDLARKARRMVKQTSLTNSPIAIDQLDSPDKEILKGLLKSQPKYYIGDQTLTVDDYIDFQEPEQIQRCWNLLKKEKLTANS